MGPLELGVRGGGGAARRCGAPVSAAAHRRVCVCVCDRRAEAPWQRAHRKQTLTWVSSTSSARRLSPRGLGAPMHDALFCARRAMSWERAVACAPPPWLSVSDARILLAVYFGWLCIFYCVYGIYCVYGSTNIIFYTEYAATRAAAYLAAPRGGYAATRLAAYIS